MFDSELPGSPEQVIGAFKDGKTTYAKIFECLCVYVKLILLRCEIFASSCFCNWWTVDIRIALAVITLCQHRAIVLH